MQRFHLRFLEMNVLLVNPKHNGKSDIPPLGLECIAAVLLKNDITASIVDLDVYPYPDIYEYLLAQLQIHKPVIVGVTSMSNSFESALEVCRMAKELDSGILTVIGGIHATVLSDSILEKHTAVDVTVRGEGEISFLEVTKNFLHNMPSGNIEGISFRNGGNIVHNRDRKLRRDLDSFPLPAHDLVKNEDYETRSISSSRGCFHNCSFCSIQSLYHKIVRTRSISNIIDEIENLINCGAKRIMFTDDNFTFSLKRVQYLCGEIIRRRLHEKVVFYAEGRIDDICRTPVMAQILSDAGFRGLYVGAESGSEEILDYYRKGITPDDIYKGVSYCVEQNLMPVVNFILYGPMDTVETMRQTISLAKRLYENGAEIVYAETLTPYPGTPIKEELERDGKFRESQGIYYFESYEDLDIDRILQLCNVARDITYLTHKDDPIFEMKKVYF
ncbi:MAG: B12-binding domain-containing radical SAM protein, partial [Deltaproteobacteria bacterium]|nr:B12-binding domain-containing radical SAM protein [Deltaproteobacteria bacterium]